MRAVHRDEDDEERSSSALQARTLAQRDQRLVNPQGECVVAVPVIADLIRNPEGRTGQTTRQHQPTESPSPLMGEESKVRVKQDNINHIPLSLDGIGSKPVPVPDTGSRG